MIKKFHINIFVYLTTLAAITATELYHKLSFLGGPLIGDEAIYGNPKILEGLHKWLELSFGHPPGWFLINYFSFNLFGTSNLVIQCVGMVAALLSISLLFWTLYRLTNIWVALMVAALLSNRLYFSFAFIMNHPVIMASIFGTLSLIFLHKKKYWTFSLTLLIALMIRESTLVFLLSSFIVRVDKKMLQALLPPTLAIAATYFVHFIANGNILFNDQMRIIVNNGHSVHIWSLSQLTQFIHNDLILQSTSIALLTICFIFCGSTLLLLKKIPLQNNKLIYGLIFAGSLHALFFAFYRDSTYRNSFMSSTCFLTALSIIYFQLLSQWKNLWLLGTALAFGIFIQNFENAEFTKFHYSRADNERKSLIEIESFLLGLLKNNPNLQILTTNPYNKYLNNPRLGYTQVGVPVRWHGGIKGYTSIGEPDVIVTTNKDLYHTFATEELLQAGEKNPLYSKKIFPLNSQEGLKFILFYKKNLPK